MKYKILLQDRQTGATTTLLASPRDCVETLSPRIKVALSLPYLDYGMHRFLARGTAYILADRLYVEPEIRFECDLHVGRYASSEHISIGRIFTTLGSAISYEQDNPVKNKLVRCTLIARIT